MEFGLSLFKDKDKIVLGAKKHKATDYEDQPNHRD